jgi:hypothetical protein
MNRGSVDGGLAKCRLTPVRGRVAKTTNRDAMPAPAFS